MQPARLDLVGYRGDALNRTISITDSAGAPADTTTTTYHAMWRENPDDVLAVTFTVTVLSPGTLRITLSGAQTALLPENGVWDFEQRPPGTDPVTLLAGTVLISKDITR